MKMKHIYLLASLILIGFTGFSQEAECNSSEYRSNLKRGLIPDYRYDSFKLSSFTTSSEFQGKKIQIPLYDSEKYRFVFDVREVGKNFQIYISTKKDTKKGKVLFALKDVLEEGKSIYTYDVENEDELFITYIVPPSVEGESSFCIAFMIGYKL